MSGVSITSFDSAEHEYDAAWSVPSNTRFELPPVDVNKVLRERYQVKPVKSLTRAMIWDMETKKSLGSVLVHSLCGLGRSVMGPDNSARRLRAVQPVINAAGMDQAGRGAGS